MSTMFTVEENNLICVFAEKSIAPDTIRRAKVIQDISNYRNRWSLNWIICQMKNLQNWNL